MVKVPKSTEIKSKLIDVEKAFKKFQKNYEKENETKEVCIENTDDLWGECFDLLMCPFEDDSEIERRIEIYDSLHNTDIQLANVASITENERDILKIRLKNAELLV